MYNHDKEYDKLPKYDQAMSMEMEKYKQTMGT